MKPVYAIVALFFIPLITSLVSAQPCLTTADADCGGSVDILELNAHIRAWYRCSACITDLFNAIEAYYGIPFCGDHGCDATEDCSSCPSDCGCGTGFECIGGVCSQSSATGCGTGYVCRYGSCVAETPFSMDYVSYWKLDTETAGKTPDETGANEGTLINNATISTDAERGQVLGLNMDYVDVNEQAPLDFTQNFTVMAWFKKRGSAMAEIVTRSHGGSGIGYRWEWNGGRFRVDANIDGTWTVLNGIGSGLLMNQWQHVAFTFNETNDFTFYVDGERNSVRSASGPILYDASSRIHIGGAWRGTYWNGSIDDVMIFGRVLSDREIQEIYDTQSGRVWPVPSKTYYVAVGGDDSNPGTINEPFATIRKTRDTIRWTCEDGVTVNIRGGTHYLNETLGFDGQDSGRPGEPNLYMAYPGEEVIIKGSKRIPVSEFSTYSGNIVRADLSGYGITEFYQMFMNRKRLIAARHPNHDPADSIRGGWLFANDNTSGDIHYNPGDFDPTGWDISDAWVDIFSGPNYGNYLMPIQSIDNVNRVIDVSGGRSPTPGNRYYIANVFQVLDSENEWYFDKSSKMLYLYPEHPLTASDEITVPMAINVISLNGADYLEFRGLDVEETWTRGTQPLYTNDKGNCFYIYDSGFITIDSCKISNSGTHGVFVGDGWNVTVRSSEISNTGREAIKAKDSTDHFKNLINTGYLFTNNTIHDTNEIEIIWSGAIITTTVGTVISYNHIYDIPRVAVLLYTGNDNVVEYNHIHDVNLKTEDTGSLYFIPGRCYQRGNVFRHNFVNGSGGLCQYGGQLYYPCYSFGIYLDNAGSGISVFGNTIINTTSAGILINGGRDNIVENNTVVENMHPKQIQFGGSWGNGSQWYDQLQSMDADGYDSALYYQRYPELLTIRPDLTADEVIGNNRVRNNVFIYPETDSDLYSAGAFDLNTNDFDNNIIWQGLDPVYMSVKGLTWDQWRQAGLDVDSALVGDVFETSIYNTDFSDDYVLLINTEHQDRVFSLATDRCDLDGNVVSGSVTLKPFESRILLSCFCNDDIVCNNRETMATCPSDCTETCTDGNKNQDETDIDCGGIICSGCALGEACTLNMDCLSNNCVGNACAAANFPTDYVSYWKLDAEAGGETPDEAGKNPGIMKYDAAIVADAVRGQVLGLDGSSDIVEINERTPLDFTQNFTLLAWYRKVDTSMDEIAARAHGGAGIGYRWDWNAYRFRIDANFDGAWTILNGIGSGLLTDQWQHVAFTFNESNVFIFYVDGNFNSVRSAPGQVLYDSGSKLLIGGAWATWNGMIDDVMIYDRVLSPGEIRQVYDAQK